MYAMSRVAGVMEFQLEAAFVAACSHAGSLQLGYPCIVGSGARARAFGLFVHAASMKLQQHEPLTLKRRAPAAGPSPHRRPRRVGVGELHVVPEPEPDSNLHPRERGLHFDP